MIFCKYLGMIHHGCNMTQMSLHKYAWIMSCSRIKSLANSLHIPLENGISGHRICNTLPWNACGYWSNCFCQDSQFKMAQQASKSLIKSFILLSSQTYDVSLLGKTHVSPLSHFVFINILQVDAVFFLERKMKSKKKSPCQILSYTTSHVNLIIQV